jgi:hypothetical protein
MTMLAKCPSCGLESNEIRCPRCNALKVIGCGGTCSTCGSGCVADGCTVPAPPATRPSEAAAEDDEHAGTPLTR